MMSDQITQWIGFLVAMILITSVLMVGCRRLHEMIRLFALQSFGLSLITLLIGFYSGSHHPYFAAGLTFIGKCFLIPWALHQVMKRVQMRGEVETYISLPSSMLISGGIIVFGFYLTHFLSIAEGAIYAKLLGLSMALVLIGLFIMMTRKKAFTEVIGLYVMENGVYTLTIATIFEMPLIVEMGIFLDLLIGIMVLGIWVFRIKQSFDTVNVQELTKLRG